MQQPTAPSTATDPTPRRRRRGVLGCLGAVLVAGLVLLLIAAALLWRYGPSYGIHLVPPSPQAYAEQALRMMDEGYYATGPEWERARSAALEETAEASSYAQTLPALREALAVAGGKHSRLFDEGESLADQQDERALPTVDTDDGITTVTLPPMLSDDLTFRQQYAQETANAVQAAAPSSCGWIVDVRGNGGGDMNPMLAGVSPLLTQGPVASFVDRRGERSEVVLEGGTVRVAGSDTLSVRDVDPAAGPVAVLQDSGTASSAEVVALAFRGAPGTRSFGGTTAGYATANQPMRLYDGTQMLLTVAVTQDRQGTTYEDAVEPDAETPEPEQDARAWLRQECAAGS